MSFPTACPLPLRNHSHVLLAHGGGGKLMQELIGDLFVPAFQNQLLAPQHDASVFQAGNQRWAMTTDSFVVRPMFFPGGDLGSLSVHGTVNDLAMAGARPRYLSAGFILEEGLPMETLAQLVTNMQTAARAAGVDIITGDTKVVDKGKGDGVFINTTGLGILDHDLEITPRSIKSGDAILVSGDVGRHGMAIMAVREGLSFESTIESDSAPIWDPVDSLLKAGLSVHCLRDITRGGLTSVLNELTESSGLGMVVEEEAVPVREDVRAACELLGLDPFQVACEGRFVAILPSEQAQTAVSILRNHPVSQGARAIGRVTDEHSRRVLLNSRIGAQRILDMASGEQLPRIC